MPLTALARYLYAFFYKSSGFLVHFNTSLHKGNPSFITFTHFAVEKPDTTGGLYNSSGVFPGSFAAFCETFAGLCGFSGGFPGSLGGLYRCSGYSPGVIGEMPRLYVGVSGLHTTVPYIYQALL